MSPLANRNMLLSTITEGSKKVDILGYMTWWSMRNVSITRDKFQELLEQNGFNKNYAVEHNYMSTFKRALKSLEEKRIIRIVSDTSFLLRCQFTEEKLVDDGLEYDRETIIEVNKEIYRKEKDLSKAITQGKPEIVTKLIELFNYEKVRYNSHDMNRYIQSILGKEADIISLRDQGCLYFVPAGYQSTLDSINKMASAIGNSTFITMPVPNLSVNQTLIKTAIKDDVENALSTLEEEVEQASKDKKAITKVWSGTRINRIKKLQQRLVAYSEVLGKDTDLQKSAENLEKEIMKFRVLEVDD